MCASHMNAYEMKVSVRYGWLLLHPKIHIRSCVVECIKNITPDTKYTSLSLRNFYSTYIFVNVCKLSFSLSRSLSMFARHMWNWIKEKITHSVCLVARTNNRICRTRTLCLSALCRRLAAYSLYFAHIFASENEARIKSTNVYVRVYTTISFAIKRRMSFGI